MVGLGARIGFSVEGDVCPAGAKWFLRGNFGLQRRLLQCLEI